MEKNIETKIEEDLQGWDGTTESIVGAVKEITFAADEEIVYEGMYPYTNSYGGTIVAAVVLDKDGKFNVSEYHLAGSGDKNVEEKPDVPALTVSGDATIAVEEVLNQEGMINVKAQVTKVNNAFEFGWVLRFAEIKESELAANVTEAFADFGNSGMIEGAAYSEIVFGEVKDYNFLTEYAEEWGGSILAVVGLNNDGTINLCDYYVAGSGNKGTIEQGGGDEPVVGGLYPELFKGATLSVVTENLSDPTAASATVKVSNVKSGVKTFILRIVGTPSTLNAMVAEAFEDYDGTEDSIFGAVKEVTANDQEFKYEYMETYDEEWAEYAANIVVVEVVNNQPVVVAAYCCGEGVTNGTKEQEGGNTESGDINFGGGTGNFGDINNVDFNGSTK
jgi:hypothetical protein